MLFLRVENKRCQNLITLNYFKFCKLFFIEGVKLFDLGKVELPSEEKMRTDWECEKTKERNIKHMLDPVKIQTEYVNDISKITQEGKNITYIF